MVQKMKHATIYPNGRWMAEWHCRETLYEYIVSGHLSERHREKYAKYHTSLAHVLVHHAKQSYFMFEILKWIATMAILTRTHTLTRSLASHKTTTMWKSCTSVHKIFRLSQYRPIVWASFVLAAYLPGHQYPYNLFAASILLMQWE